MNILRGIKVFFFGSHYIRDKDTKGFALIDFIVYQWPRNFFRKPNGYKLTRYIGDVLHYMFLKK